MDSRKIFYGWYITIACCIGLACGLTSVLTGTFSIFLGPLVAEFGWQPSDLFVALMLATVTVTVASPFIGVLIDRFGAKRMILAGFILEGIVLASFAVQDASLGTLYARYILMTLLGLGTTHVSFARVISLWFDRQRGLALGIALAGLGVGGMIWPLLSQWAIDAYGWRTAYLIVTAVVTTLGFLAIAIIVRDTPAAMGLLPDGAPAAGAGGAATKPGQPGGFTLAQTLRQTGFWMMILAFFLVGFGTVSLGRQYAPGYDFQYDAMASAPIGPQFILSTGAGMTITPNNGARWDNSVAYNGSFSGLKVRAIYGMGNKEDSYEVPTLAGTKLMDPSDDDRFGLGVEYANGPLKVGAVYHYLTDPAEIAGASDDQQEWLVGGSYDFGVLTLAGSYQEVEGLGNRKGVDADLWQIGVLVPVGAAGNVHLAYGEVDFDINAMGVNESAKAKSYTLAYTHALSKRTTAYAGWNRTDNDNGLDLGPVDYIQPAGATTYGGDESDLFFVGMRHTF